MLYQYECDKCWKPTEESFRMGTAPKFVKCPACKGRASRVYSSPALKIGDGINRKSTFGESIRQRNLKAAHRMKGRKAPVRVAAYDHGNGDIREVGAAGRG